MTPLTWMLHPWLDSAGQPVRHERRATRCANASAGVSPSAGASLMLSRANRTACAQRALEVDPASCNDTMLLELRIRLLMAVSSAGEAPQLGSVLVMISGRAGGLTRLCIPEPEGAGIGRQAWVAASHARPSLRRAQRIVAELRELNKREDLRDDALLSITRAHYYLVG
jgi:hypothetical protein